MFFDHESPLKWHLYPCIAIMINDRISFFMAKAFAGNERLERALIMVYANFLSLLLYSLPPARKYQREQRRYSHKQATIAPNSLLVHKTSLLPSFYLMTLYAWRDVCTQTVLRDLRCITINRTGGKMSPSNQIITTFKHKMS